MLKLLTLPKYGWLPRIKYVQVQTHSRCNADCVFCPYIESAHVKQPGVMTDETWNLILDNLVPFTESINQGKFCPYLMQEPLIDKTIFDKIANIYEVFSDTCVEVSTNGAALTEKVADRLLGVMEGRRHDIWVSHHGVDKDSLEHIMQINYEKAVSNLIHLLKVSDGRYTIRIRGAGKSNIKYSCDRIYFTKEEYLDYWDKLFSEHNINRTNVDIDYFAFHDRAGTLLREDRGANLLNAGVIRKIDPQHPFYCTRIDEWVHFMWDGTIRLCCMDYHGEVKLPNIHKMSLLDYFHGPEYYDLVAGVSGAKGCEPGFICTRCVSPGG